MTDEPERKRSENGTAGLGDERAASRVVRGVERAREAEDGKSSACCLEKANAEREPEEKLQHEIAIDGLSEERHRCFPSYRAKRASSCHPTLCRSAAACPQCTAVAPAVRGHAVGCSGLLGGAS